MARMSSRFWSLSFALGMVGLLLSDGCAEKRPAINRVQPFAIQKSLLVGDDLQDPADNPEFYALATLIDVGGYGASQDGLFTSTYAQNLVRIKWQVTEDMLIGRLAYERIDGADGRGTGAATNNGTVVLAFPIEKHFDIVRAYNPTTGEKLNIWEENASDRPWYEREYMRVNWSKNQATDAYDFDTLSLLGVYGSITYEPLAYDVTNPDDPEYAPVFDLENGYFDITNKAFAQPGMIDLSSFGWGIDKFPACFLPDEFMSGSYPAGSCNPIELTFRFSFKRVDPKNDFEPKDWDGYRFKAYGAFYRDRLGYARNYGITDLKWHRFIERYNIWEQNHFYLDPVNMTGPVECYTPETTPPGADPNRDEDGNGTADECEVVGAGSQCDTFKQKCTLPYAQRVPKPLQYYMTNTSDYRYFDGSKMAAHEWDVALRIAVQTARYAECQATGQTGCLDKYPVPQGQEDDMVATVRLAQEVDSCRNGYAYAGQDCDALAEDLASQRNLDPALATIAKMPEMIVVCHSPTQADDPAPCAGPRLPEGVTAQDCQDAKDQQDTELMATCAQAHSVRLGDIRYHIVNLIKEPQTPSPWGIWTGATDPLTGEIISNCVNVWTWVNDYVGQLWVDTMRYIRGELSDEDITDAKHVQDWVRAAEAASKGGVFRRASRAQIDRSILQMAGFRGEQHRSLAEIRAGMPESALRAARSIAQQFKGVKASAGVASSWAPLYAARRKAAAGTHFEAELMTPMMQQLYGVAGMPITDGVMDRVSPLRGGNLSWQHDLYNLKQMALGKRGACVIHPQEALAPESMLGLAKIMEEKFEPFSASDDVATQLDRAARMIRFLANRVHYAVIVHEMGHGVGMRHNFVSSSYAYAYRPQYWQLRTRNGQVTQECSDLVTDGSTCIGPRYLDPVTDEEEENLIWMWMHSSVMDYAGEHTQDLLGLGAYDFAAARMFYGGVVSVIPDSDSKVGTPKGRFISSLTDNFGGILGYRYEIGQNTIHYSALQKTLGLIQDCQTIPDPTIFKPATWNEERDGKWSPLLDGLIVKVNGQYSRCRQQKVDYVPWNQLHKPTASDLGGSPDQGGVYYDGGPSVDPQGRLRVPYGFATDSWADLGNASVYRHDNGADVYEIFNFMATQREVDHIFNDFRRGRTGFSVRSAANRALGRYYIKMRDGAKGLGLIKNFYEDIALQVGQDFSALWAVAASQWYEPVIVASSQVFDHFTRLMARPESGDHVYAAGDDPILRSTEDFYGNYTSVETVIPDGATGRYGDISLGGALVENRLSDNHGEYDRDYTMNCGQYYDKLVTSMLMTESVDNFISSSRNDFVDPRYRAVSLADLFPEGYRRWIANNLTGDDFLKGARLAADDQGHPINNADGYPDGSIGYITWWTDPVQVCFPNNGTTLCTVYGAAGNPANPLTPAHVAVVDPEVGWEQQKFLIAWTMLYLPENEQMHWLDMLRLWELGVDADPDLGNNRIEFHNPMGKVYVAKTFGKEDILGQTVQRGIAARVLEYANKLLQAAYETTGGQDLDGDGNPDWYMPVFNPATGQPIVRYDPSVTDAPAGCNATDNTGCQCTSNRACQKLSRYVSIPAYLREAMDAYQLGQPEQRGIYD